VKKKIGGHRLCFKKTTLILIIIQHGLKKFIVKNIEGDSMEANNLSLILFKWVHCINNSNFYQRFNDHIAGLDFATKSANKEVFLIDSNVLFHSMVNYGCMISFILSHLNYCSMV